MAALCSICLCPLMVLRLAKTSVLESHDNSGHFDILYSVFVLLAFVPTVASPLTFLYWFMEGTGRSNFQHRLSPRQWLSADCGRCDRSREVRASELMSCPENMIRETCIR
ncbi:hypothetical protein J6590_015980 [Homalodisca vitripennis]|nr:hypothetical protein J6590_015980 [Homalodisca vitripennis]